MNVDEKLESLYKESLKVEMSSNVTCDCGSTTVMVESRMGGSTASKSIDAEGVLEAADCGPAIHLNEVK